MTRAEFGERIRQQRERLGLSQVELARACGVQQQQVSKWEKGRTIPGRQTLPLLADVLDLVPDLFVWVSDVSREDATEAERELADVRSYVDSLRLDVDMLAGDVASIRSTVDNLAEETSNMLRQVLGQMGRLVTVVEGHRADLQTMASLIPGLRLRISEEQIESG